MYAFIVVLAVFASVQAFSPVRLGRPTGMKVSYFLVNAFEFRFACCYWIFFVLVLSFYVFVKIGSS
jgi:hypothetical protein